MNHDDGWIVCCADEAPAFPDQPRIIPRVRDAHAAKFNYDLRVIFRDLKAKEAASGRTYVASPTSAPGL